MHHLMHVALVIMNQSLDRIMWMHGACYPTSFSGKLVLDRLSRHSCADDFCLSCYTGKIAMSRVSYGTLLSVILTYNSETTSSILTKFSERKRSSMDNILAKFRYLEIVAMETVN